MDDITAITIQHQMQDTMVCKADPSGFYSTKSEYRLLMTFNRPIPQRRILQTIEACNAHNYPFLEEQPIPLTGRSHVYSFGVVLLELLTGRRPVGNFGEEGIDIVQCTKLQTNWSNDKVVKILDERLCHIPLDEAKQVYFVAMLCVQEQSVERPTMREVVEMLA
ncbi:leucine-rich repeat receptor-like serine/threonine-protein kinase BAM3 [Glycine soja]|uniref:leucine-rich repeat receptor-like serine/threonine-protein kinase BAM3 n=1 Tax=Glycine max TaxID=3847 RepID=UPI0003DE7527|nr:leucine-rich repeat receptor-like serine/threonine-protein kinase BAM3 [Glycine max]XP_028184647.1 leucine-rich repeat receptor-like serine/threonine-protein kinase BAM3 [Glycine soja]|eukprot:XP_006589895.1 leucine-rich repeat receptor-like serine/threonine-protein kinase BAM3 [Glycine max]